MRELVVWLSGRRAGVVAADSRRRWSLRYDAAYRERVRAIPLSMTLPLSAVEHRHEAVAPWLWGLLPDSPPTLQAWARQFGVPHDDALGLLAQVGEDCPGAVQLVRPEREPALAGPDEPPRWIDDAEIAARLRALRLDGAAWRRPDDVGWFSLAGAQPKTALLLHQGRWAVPSGRVPTTHIFKPSLPSLRHHAINEHLCLSLARELGLAAARSEVRHFDSEVAIIVERFDRVAPEKLAALGGGQAAAAAARSAMAATRAAAAQSVQEVAAAAAHAATASAEPAAWSQLPRQPFPLRVHQEDLCQALGVMPGAKYQAQGGPSPRDIVGLLRRRSARPVDDVAAFLDALALQWLIGGTDGHAKNYALLLGGSGAVRLAPLYDLASIFAYPQLLEQRPRLAMKIGGSYEPRRLATAHWRKLAEEAEIDGTALILRIAELAEALVAAAPAVGARAKGAGLDAEAIDDVVTPIGRWAARCARVLALPAVTSHDGEAD